MRYKIFKSEWFRRNRVPFVIETVFLLAVFYLPRETYVYSNFLFYLCLFVYGFAKLGFSPQAWLSALKKRRTWKSVGWTGVGVILVGGASMGIAALLPDKWLGMIKLPARTSTEMFLFAVSTMFLAPISEELFYRKSLILLNSKKSLWFTSVLSSLLYALNHAVRPIGILIVSLWAVPFAVSYIKTKDIAVPMTAHLMINLSVNGTALMTALF